MPGSHTQKPGLIRLGYYLGIKGFKSLPGDINMQQVLGATI